MKVSSYQVLETSDYNLFSFMKGNREVNPFNLKRIKTSMQSQPLFSPILVNEKMEIIDGQHRFIAQKELKLPIYFIKVDGYGVKEVHTLNSNTSNWKRIDFLQGYVDMGLRPYIQLKDFLDQYPDFGIKVALHIVTLKNSGQEKSKSKYFERGELKTFDMNYAKKIADMVYDFKPFYKGFSRQSFIAALTFIFANRNYKHDRMMSKLQRISDQISDQSNYRAYIDQLEDIYNFHSREKVSLKYYR